MYYRQASNQHIVEGMQFTIDGITYPSSWLSIVTEQDKTNLGLEFVVTIGEFKDGKYYNNSEVLNGATLTITSVAKPLNEVKTQAVQDIRATAYSILFPSDWMVVKAMETSTPIPADWNTWRASIRTTAADTVTAINAATDVDAVANVMANIVWANDPNYVVPTE